MDIRCHTRLGHDLNKSEVSKSVLNKLDQKNVHKNENSSNIYLSESKCAACYQTGLCITCSVNVKKFDEIRELTICGFCFREILFSGVSNILPDDFNWELVICGVCKRKRLKSPDEDVYCNCTK